MLVFALTFKKGIAEALPLLKGELEGVSKQNSNFIKYQLLIALSITLDFGYK